MKFGPNILRMIQLLHLNPTAMIQTNSDISLPIPLSRGIRQGCPLSPLLFALAIKPLAIAVRSHLSISGVGVGDADHVIWLYADDILLYLTNLDSSPKGLLVLYQMDIPGYIYCKFCLYSSYTGCAAYNFSSFQLYCGSSLQPILFNLECSVSLRCDSCRKAIWILSFFNFDRIFPLLIGLSILLMLKEATLIGLLCI